MRYLGSKSSTADAVYTYAHDLVPEGTFCDPFGGIGVLGAYFKERGYSVWSGDILRNAYHFQVARIQRRRAPVFRRLRERLGLRSAGEVVQLLNRARRSGSWFEREYSQKRWFFTKENAERIAGCQALIGTWARQGMITSEEKAVLLASLVDSMDKVANTAGTYYAHLKEWYRKALRPFRFELVAPAPGHTRCWSFHSDAKELVVRRRFDILYLDPPYNARCYASYYHLPESIATESRQRVHGRSGIPVVMARRSSRFNRPAEAYEELKELLDLASFRLMILHYSDSGIISPGRLRRLLCRYGDVCEQQIAATGYTTAPRDRTTRHRLYLVLNA